MTAERVDRSLDPVTFEVLKNVFGTIVDQMAEQLLRTCHSFVIYCRDFSSALCDADGNTIAQGSQDIASHVGTLHFTAKAVIEAFGSQIAPGDVFAINDPYLGGTHFCDVRLLRPIFADDALIAFAQCNGHWADVGGSVPGSVDVTATEHFAEGIRIPPVRVWSEGRYLDDVVRLIVSNTRTPEIATGDLLAQAQATKVAEAELLRVVQKYGRETVLTAFSEVQDYVEQVTRQRLVDIPDGEWTTTDFLDCDPTLDEEGLIPVKLRMTIAGDEVTYDLSGSHPAIRSCLNAAFGASFSSVVGGTKIFFPDIPLNSGFYRAVKVDLGPPGSVVNAAWPTAVTGFASGAHEKITNGIFEIWSRIMPERALACSYNNEYLLVGGRDGRRSGSPYFMWYDWMVGGWGGRSTKDGSSATAPVFGVGLATQPVEGQEVLSPILTTRHELVTDSGGPGRFRGGLGVEKGAIVTEAVDATVSYVCDRARAITWGIAGGLPSMPHGVWLNQGRPDEEFLGAMFATRPVRKGDLISRPSAGGGGYGDPLERDPLLVREDVADEYVSVDRALADYGVVIKIVDEALAAYEVDDAATEGARRSIRAERAMWLRADPEAVAERYRSGELDALDVIRRYGVILDWGTGELFARTTAVFRESIMQRSARHWRGG